MSEDHLSLGKIAKQCNVSRTTVYRWIVNGHLKAYSLPSGHYRVHPNDLKDFRKAFSIPSDDDRAAESSTDSSDDDSLRVLIADDHPDMVMVLRKVVERYLPDAKIFEAINGVDTCISVGTVRPHIMLLDIMMPGMDGFAVLQELLRRQELADSKVIVVSAYEPFDRVEEIGKLNPQVVSCVHKPISVENLGNQIQEIANELNVAGKN
ncbi:MAG: response regulator [Planctomycetes bacterium]|nr:response regulator [Planctomycetota bacterium]